MREAKSLAKVPSSSFFKAALWHSGNSSLVMVRQRSFFTLIAAWLRITLSFCEDYLISL